MVYLGNDLGSIFILKEYLKLEIIPENNGGETPFSTNFNSCRGK